MFTVNQLSLKYGEFVYRIAFISFIKIRVI